MNRTNVRSFALAVMLLAIMLLSGMGCGTQADDPEREVACEALDEKQCEAAVGRCRVLEGYPYDTVRGCFDRQTPTYFGCRETNCGFNNVRGFAVGSDGKRCYALTDYCEVDAPFELTAHCDAIAIDPEDCSSP